MRRHLTFTSEGTALAATLDPGERATGLLIVSGGNEIRSGAHRGQARLAQAIAARGYPVLRYDPPGVGDSEGKNLGYAHRVVSLRDAASCLRGQLPPHGRIVAFGNCDAATLILLSEAAIDQAVVANPWVYDEAEAASTPAPAAIRSRYARRLREPGRLIADLLHGRLDLRKAAGGLRKAASRSVRSSLAERLSATLADARRPTHILLATRDTTASSFAAQVHLPVNPAVSVQRIDSPSHSFADANANAWLLAQIIAALEAEDQLVADPSA